MQIVAIESIPVSVPIHPGRAVVGARGRHDRSPFLLVRLHTDEGLTGLGEVSCTPVWSGEDAVTAAHVLATYISPRLIGQDPRHLGRVAALVDGAIAANTFTKAGVEMALWDIAGKTLGVSVSRLLGGPVRDGVRTKFSIGAFEPGRAAEVAAWAVEQGFSAMKVKVGLDVEEDLRRVRAVREAVGEQVLLGVDANGGWPLGEAQRACRALREGMQVAFVEQPVAAEDLAGMAVLRDRLDVPVVADESVGTPADALRVAESGAADVLSIYVGMAGGIARARRIAELSETARLGWTIGSNLELGVALAAHLHLACGLGGLADRQVPCDVISPFYYEADVLATPLRIDAGWAEPPAGAGLGVELDEELVDRYRQDR